MTLDQTIQVWIAVGAWLGAIATFTAVVVSLWLATRAEKVRLRAYAAVLQSFIGDGSPPEEFIGITAVNLSDRPVTIISVGWKIGRGKRAEFCVQPLPGPALSDQYPIELAHGKQATFKFSLRIAPNWVKDFATGFVKGANLRTLRAQIHTTVGKTTNVVPAESILKRLRSVRHEQFQHRRWFWQRWR